MTEKQTIPIFFSIDKGYIPYFATALCSIMDNASDLYDYQIIVLFEGLDNMDIQRILDLQKPGFTISFIPMQDKLVAFSDHNRYRCDYFTLTIYFRIFIPAMFPQYDKGIYLDSDIAVPGDISKLYELELGDNLIGACMDHSVQEIKPFTDYIDKAIGVDHTQYINSGVLLMNMKALREAEFDRKFLHLLETYHFDSVAPDQDYINAMCHGRILYLSEEWDAMPNDNKRPLSSPKLVHYNLFSKPWCADNVQYEEYFWKYAEHSGFHSEIINFKKSYTDKQREADRLCLENMVTSAVDIVENGSTFASVFNTGLEMRL